MQGSVRSTTLSLAMLAVVSAGVGCSKEPAPAPTPAPTPTVAAAAAPAAAPATTPGAQEAVQKLLVWADSDPDTGDAPLAVEFTCDPLEDIDTPKYSWDFGDGSPPSSEQNPKHTYQRPGDYVARVRVTDKDGNIGEDETQISVDAPAAPKAKDEGAPAPGSQTRQTLTRQGEIG
jgi:hypothetical protein